jgi:hypothetical protein
MRSHKTMKANGLVCWILGRGETQNGNWSAKGWEGETDEHPEPLGEGGDWATRLRLTQ